MERKSEGEKRNGGTLFGVTLTELLVVISIMVILMGIMASALGVFRHTASVDAAADSVAAAFRAGINTAMARNARVIPIFLRDRKGQFTIVQGVEAFHFKGTMDNTFKAPNTFAPGDWTMIREDLEGLDFQNGVFVFMLGSPTMDLNASGTDKAFYEVIQLQVTPPKNEVEKRDSAKYTYKLLARGVHNTALGTFTPGTTNNAGVVGFAILGNTAMTGAGQPVNLSGGGKARDYTLHGVRLPEGIEVDQVPSLDSATPAGPVQATLTAQAAIFFEKGQLVANGGKHIKPQHFPIFLPAFKSDGTIDFAVARNLLGGIEMSRLNYEWPFPDFTIRVRDRISREYRFVNLKLGGSNAQTGEKELPLPWYYSIDPMNPDKTNPFKGSSGIPGYNDYLNPTSSTSSSTSTSSTSASTSSTTSATSSNSSTNSSTASTASTSSSTGTGSSTSSTSASTASTASTGTTTTTGSNSASSTGSTSSSSSSSSSTSTSASSTSSTGTGSTTASTSSATSASSSSSTASNSATSSTATSATGSTTSSSTASTTGAGGGTSGGTSGGASGTGG